METSQAGIRKKVSVRNFDEKEQETYRRVARMVQRKADNKVFDLEIDPVDYVKTVELGEREAEEQLALKSPFSRKQSAGAKTVKSQKSLRESTRKEKAKLVRRATADKDVIDAYGSVNKS